MVDQKKVQKAIKLLLEGIGEDTDREGLKETPERIGRMYEEICGGMVAYKLIQILYEKAGIDREEWLAMIEFAAIATVGDVMKLQDENRILVNTVLKRWRQTKNLGLSQTRTEKNNLDLGAITAYHIGFVRETTENKKTCIMCRSPLP